MNSVDIKYTRGAGGIVVNRRSGKVLVVSQRGMHWSLPKGHIDDGEDALSAAIREIHEESGVEEASLELIEELGAYERYKMSKEGGDDLSEQKHITLFLFLTDQDELTPLDPHNPEAIWVHIQEVPQLLTHRKDKEFFISQQEKIRSIQTTTIS